MTYLPDAIEEIEGGLSLTSADVAKAMVSHGQLLERMRRFQEKYEYMLCAVNQVPPFDTKLDWPKAIAGVKMEHYVAWMKSAHWITTTFRPASSVPVGFTPDGLPAGIQIVGRYREDMALLQMAHAFEQATGLGKKHPPVAEQSAKHVARGRSTTLALAQDEDANRFRRKTGLASGPTVN